MPPIMIVDDSSSIRFVLRHHLTRKGYPVIEAEDGEAALNLMRHLMEPHIVLLDVQMPRCTGDEILRRVQHEWPPLRHRFIVMTGTREIPEPLARLVAAFDAPLLIKPFASSDLFAQVEWAGEQLAAQHLPFPSSTSYDGDVAGTSA